MADVKDSFLFYRSYIDAIDKLPPDHRYAFLHAIVDYALDGKKPELEGAEDIAFGLMKANIDSCNKRYSASVENGKKGGRPPKFGKKKTQEKPSKNPNDNVNDNVNDNYHLHTLENSLSVIESSQPRAPADGGARSGANRKKVEFYKDEDGKFQMREVEADGE